MRMIHLRSRQQQQQQQQQQQPQQARSQQGQGQQQQYQQHQGQRGQDRRGGNRDRDRDRDRRDNREGDRSNEYQGRYAYESDQQAPTYMGVPMTEAAASSAGISWSADLDQVPDQVKQFIVYFRSKFRDSNIEEVHNLYEDTFNKLSQRYFKSQEWPSASVIAPLVDSDPIFLTFYKELYFRHVHANTQPLLSHRVDAWTNYCELFNLFFSKEMVDLDLPPSWIWDVIDEFIYQFEAWCQFRSKLKNKSEEEIQYLKETDHVWNVNTVLQYLHALVNISNVVSYLSNGNMPVGSADPTDEENFDLSSVSGYRYIGYFSIIGLLRIHCVLQDYRLALMVLQPLDLDDANPLYTQVSACHVALFYYVGFSYLMLRRYEDAGRVFSTTLMHIGRLKQYHTKSYQYDQINKRNDQMLALLAICLSFIPQDVEDSTFGLLREKHTETMARLRANDQALYEELFTYASPKFLSPAPPDYDNIAAETNANVEAGKLQLALFMNDVKQQVLLPEIRSYLKLYRTINISKLASFMDTDESLSRSHLLCLKHKSWTVVGSAEEYPLAGSFHALDGVHFYIDNDIVHIADAKEETKYGEHFIHQIERLDEIVTNQRIRSIFRAKGGSGAGQYYKNSRAVNRTGDRGDRGNRRNYRYNAAAGIGGGNTAGGARK
mmetsp:Transcript_19821/g.34021  ORF Transcript_19821/g.34021 Transcript_19821/m.34021 type:complete len:662 (-) Transcript_19821:57-2042(-)